MVTGISCLELAEHFPRLYHMAELGSWPAIRAHGLLSTSALLDLFEIGGDSRARIEGQHRPESLQISHPVHGVAVIRDQKPMDDRGLRKALPAGMSPSDWYRVLNRRVFFWLSEHRLERLLGARAYRNRAQTVLTVDTTLLLAGHHARVTLSPINSGCTKPNPQPRGPETFLPLTHYPFAAWRDKRRSSRDAVVELAVEYSVPDICEFVVQVDDREQGRPPKVVWKRDA